jgi:hypothetical protein
MPASNTTWHREGWVAPGSYAVPRCEDFLNAKWSPEWRCGGDHTLADRRGYGAGWGNSHMKGFTVLWMCLCCFRPEDVAKVLPQSGQAWARAPTCCERICRCRLLGSVNTWGGGLHWPVYHLNTPCQPQGRNARPCPLPNCPFCSELARTVSLKQ